MKASWTTGLRDYQLEAAEWLQHPPNRGRLLALKPGLGKTAAAIAGLRIRYDAGQLDSAVPVVTTAIARSDWHREVKRWWPEARVHIMRVDEPEYRKKGEASSAFQARRRASWVNALKGDGSTPTLLVASYEAVRDLHDASIEHELLFDTCVWDEIHIAKRERNLTSVLLRTLVSKARINFLLTGTPVHNRPTDLFNLLQIMDPLEFPSFMRWASKFFMIRSHKFGQNVDELLDKPGLNRFLQPYFFDIPPEVALGALPPRQRYLRRISVKEAVRISPAKLNGLKSGSGLDKALRAMVRHKMKVAVDLCRDLEEPIVCYTYKKRDARALVERLRALEIPTTLAMGTGEEGGTTPQKRAELIEAWKAGGTRVLVCTMDAVRESATLTHAACMIFLDLDWLPGKMLQLEGRIDPSRQPEGERRPVRYYYLLVEGGADEVVAERVIKKITEAQGIIGASDAGTEALKTMLSVVKRTVDLSPSEMLADLVSHLEARAGRLEEVGMFDMDWSPEVE